MLAVEARERSAALLLLLLLLLLRWLPIEGPFVRPTAQSADPESELRRPPLSRLLSSARSADRRTPTRSSLLLGRGQGRERGEGKEGTIAPRPAISAAFSANERREEAARPAGVGLACPAARAS
ncbi:hypothetical protein FA09DRAFT_330589 [Tilletiopsis washingtonensis]|uniref:Uncharacterized protein n=1 Tax=Tilletiopsis washingtonensis TaxID=58919 RepID=A0A316Z8W5_9BASI|nr:hypothetical protein FA09DRAFT_330589 [Tilletiopsis washingtonensis]PWN97428.1 hypothetical protein FA09DRAFT_330589 [Tilletiopsis washingtonensis]